MRLRSLRKNLNLAGKRILVRIDANVPIKKGKTIDGKHGKIARAAVDIDWLAQRGARVIVMTHVGRPKGKKVSAYSAKAVAKRLSQLMGSEVKMAREVVGPSVEKTVAKLNDGEVLLLENVRFDPREERNSPAFARALAKLADFYVNDAFSVCHRAHASIDAITSELPSFAGPLLMNEVTMLSRLVRTPKPPFYLIMGGLKLETKLPVMKRLLPQVEKVLIGGALATAFLKAQGHEVGGSVYDKEGVNKAKTLLKKWDNKIMLPKDVIVASSFRGNAKVRSTPVDMIRPREKVVDVGKNTVNRYVKELKKASTIAWNGPFGYCEREQFCKGTSALARGIAARTGKALTIVGGGDTVPYIESQGLYDKFSLVSTGGGAMLAFLAGDDLPGVEALKV